MLSLAHTFLKVVDFAGLRTEMEEHFYLSYTLSRLIHEKNAIREFIRNRRCRGQHKISLILPLWGIPSFYVKELFECVDEQTYTNWELCVCVDGDSDPRLSKLLERYQRRWGPRMRIARHETNLGISRATRTAIELSRGDILAFVDGDDLLHKQALECFALRYEESPDIDFVYSDMDFVTDWGLRHWPVRKPGWSPHLLKNAMYISHLKSARRPLVMECLDAFDSCYDGSQDWNFTLKATSLARRVSHIPLILYHWRRRQGSMAAGANAKPWALEAGIAVQAKHYADINPRVTLAENPKLSHGRVPLLKESQNPLVLVQVRSPNEADFFHYVPEPARFHSIIRLTAKEDLAMTLALWDQHLLQLPDQSLLLFHWEGCGTILGDIGSMEIFAAMADVGAVWPCVSAHIRYGYTIDAPARGMVPLGWDRSFFAGSISNILTGPLHALMIQVKKLKEIGGFSGLRSSLITRTHHEVGIRLGLESLRRGYRNVSVHTALCMQTLPPVDCEHDVYHDPYCAPA